MVAALGPELTVSMAVRPSLPAGSAPMPQPILGTSALEESS